MAKNTHAQEASTGTSDSYTEDEIADAEAPLQVLITRPDLSTVDRPAPVMTEPGCKHPQCVLDHPHAGPAILDPAYASSAQAKEVSPSVGNNSGRSSTKEQTKSDKLSQSPQQPVPTTENPSNRTAKEISDVDSTDGSTPETEPPQSGSSSPRRTPPTSARKSSKATSLPAKPARSRATMMGAEDDFSEFE